MKEYKTHSYEETVKLGERVAKSLPKGSVVAFLGGLGMGKTAFTTGFAKGLGIDVDVSSPTFAICNTYIGEENTLYHFETDAYMAIEWSENVYGALPDDTLMIEIERIGENERLFKMYKKSEEEE